MCRWDSRQLASEAYGISCHSSRSATVLLSLWMLAASFLPSCLEAAQGGENKPDRSALAHPAEVQGRLGHKQTQSDRKASKAREGQGNPKREASRHPGALKPQTKQESAASCPVQIAGTDSYGVGALGAVRPLAMQRVWGRNAFSRVYEGNVNGAGSDGRLTGFYNSESVESLVLAATDREGRGFDSGQGAKPVLVGTIDGLPKEHPDFKPLTDKGDTTTFPLPAFGYNRNERYWVGALSVTLKGNEQGEVEDIIAPQVLYNPLVGSQATLNYYGYRANNVQYRAVASYSEKVAKYFDFAYKNMGAGGGRYIFAIQGTWFKNPFARFFGLGNRAPLYNETNYTSREGIGKVTAGINLGPALSVMFTGRYRDVRVEDGIISTLPNTKSRFGNATGMEGAHIFGGQLGILYDTRNDLLTPSSGTYANVSAELASNVERSAPNRWGHYVVDLRHLHPHDSGRKVFVARMLFESVTGRKVPFYERPTLGGENTLRAFGLQRFIDDQALLVNFEERIRVLTKRVFDHDIDMEMAPTLDIGRVSSKLIDRFQNFQINPGLGLRVMARPNVVGRVDVAYGKDGGNAFVGLDYPF